MTQMVLKLRQDWLANIIYACRGQENGVDDTNGAEIKSGLVVAKYFIPLRGYTMRQVDSMLLIQEKNHSLLPKLIWARGDKME